MNLYIIRHAEAENRDEWTANDADRPLTPHGHRQAQALGEALRLQGVTFDAVVSSPLVRARQTAEGILGTQANGIQPELCDLLAAASLRRRKLTKYLTSLRVESVAIVGHDPDLPNYLAWLTGGMACNLHLEKAGVALVLFTDEPCKGEGAIAWIITPDWYLAAQLEPAGV